MRKTTLAAVFALLVGALPLAATTATTASAAADGTAQLHVVNALGNADGVGPTANVTVDCAEGDDDAEIPVVDPAGTSSEDGSAYFNVEEGDCYVSVDVDETIDYGEEDVIFDFACNSEEDGEGLDFDFEAGHFYKVVIEPVFDGDLVVPVSDCILHVWEDDGSTLPAGMARITFRHAACVTGTNVIIESVEDNGSKIMDEIDDCDEETAIVPAGFHEFQVEAYFDVNGDDDHEDLISIFSPDCNDPAAFPSAYLPASMGVEGCPQIDEDAALPLPPFKLWLAAGESLALNFVDESSRRVLPLLAGGDEYDSPILAFGDAEWDCNSYIYGPLPVPDEEYTVHLVAVAAGFGELPGAPPITNCIGGGIGFTAGKATAQVILDGNYLPDSNAATQAFCNDVINNFQKTLAAETDYVKTLKVEPGTDKLDANLEVLVEATDALVQKMLTEAPLAIRPQVVILTAGITQLNQGFTAAGYNITTVGQDNLDKIQAGLNSTAPNPEIDAARAALTAWVVANCFAAAPAGVPAAPKFTG